MQNLISLTKTTEGITQIIFFGISVIFEIIQIILILPKRKKITASSGNLILKTTSPSINKTACVLILCPLLIIFCMLTRAQKYIQYLSCLLCILGSYTVCKERIFTALNGIYSNGICGGGQFVKWEQIKTFPGTDWKNPENSLTDILTIEFKPEKNQTHPPLAVAFKDVNEYVNVIKTLKQLKLNR